MPDMRLMPFFKIKEGGGGEGKAQVEQQKTTGKSIIFCRLPGKPLLWPVPALHSDRTSVAWDVKDDSGLLKNPGAGVPHPHLQWSMAPGSVSWSKRAGRTHHLPACWDALMIMDAGLLTIPFVMAHNTDCLGNESAAFQKGTENAGNPWSFVHSFCSAEGTTMLVFI